MSDSDHITWSAAGCKIPAATGCKIPV
ncbi:hypothetical protein L3X38_011640 [Prunus dulcis]|uniref:Uncharacterized protein n=1 Tax=Prunus dulcis TaxID=3755 RepID=A0AAD4ZFB3_PRUDU|nr:hypothetical protein L3X38_011640 [Prunus dulcis]